MHNFGTRLRLLRVSLGLSIQEMADKLHHSYATQAHYEHSDRNPPFVRTQEIAAALHVPLCWLLGEGKTFAFEVEDELH